MKWEPIENLCIKMEIDYVGTIYVQFYTYGSDVYWRWNARFESGEMLSGEFDDVETWLGGDSMECVDAQHSAFIWAIELLIDRVATFEEMHPLSVEEIESRELLAQASIVFGQVKEERGWK